MNILFDYITQPTIAVYHYNDVPIIFWDDWFKKTRELYHGQPYDEIAKQLSLYIYLITGKQILLFMVQPHDNIRELQWDEINKAYYDVDTNLII